VTFVTPPRKNAEPVLIGTYWRIATDLRVSLTDHCTYCMPEEGLAWLARPSCSPTMRSAD